MIRAISSLVSIVVAVSSQTIRLPPSPCPEVFSYEYLTADEQPSPGRWYGIIYLYTDIVLHSLWLNIILDAEAEKIGNWIGEVSTNDHMNFKIENADFEISPGMPTVVNFFVDFDPENVLPTVRYILFNGLKICNAEMPSDRILKGADDTGLEDLADRNPEETSRFDGPSTFRISTGEEDKAIPDIGELLLNSRPACGDVVIKPPPYLPPGSSTSEGQWPWHTAIYGPQNKETFKYICGGSLVSLHHVITAAHCVTKRGSERPAGKNLFMIHFGKFNLVTSKDGVQIKSLERIIVHPEYNASNLYRDLAILELKDTVTITDWVRPVCLWPESEIDLYHIIGEKGSVLGWGFEENGRAKEELSLLEIHIVDRDTCLNSYRQFYEKFATEDTYCASYKDGSSTCLGDNGGGMVFKRGNNWYLHGVASLSVARYNAFRCDPKHFVIFTDIAQFLPWIGENIYYGDPDTKGNPRTIDYDYRK
ncbi:chymotrypsin-like protease CTRL-1 [Anticarsia gemmatalis]|uniref:chymotrypsin-like protease CTRL-1 n=1 Tax=Anticarsia gemmatalis TaxID=129554 RepID=UPI003F76067D